MFEGCGRDHEDPTGRQFQAVGDEIANALGPIVEVFVLGTDNRPDAIDIYWVFLINPQIYCYKFNFLQL